MQIVESTRATLGYVMAVAVALAVLGTGCAPRSDVLLSSEDVNTPTPLPSDTPAPPTPTADGEQEPRDVSGIDYVGVVKFGQWDDKRVELENFLVGYLIVQGYVYQVELVDLPSADYQSALETGEVDVVVEISRRASPEWYEKVTGEGTVLDVGSLFGEDSDTRIGVHAGLKERAPELVELLGNITPGEDVLADLESRLTGGRVGIRPSVAALTFLKQHEDTWTQWVSAEVADDVKAAIEDNRTGLYRKCFKGEGISMYWCK